MTNNGNPQRQIRKQFYVDDTDHQFLHSYSSKLKIEYTQKDMNKLEERLKELQELLYAGKSKGLLVILQGLDTSGKDSTIRQVFRSVHPLGVRAFNFSKPTDAEKRHDFLWRIHQRIPQRGEMVIFNRSHYEDAVTTFVRGSIDERKRDQRVKHILAFERLLYEEGINVAKFFLNISKDEQKSRLEKRVHTAKKQWKFDPQDLTDRKKWDAYISAYGQVISQTSTSIAPWFVVPADNKADRNWIILNILISLLDELDMSYPPSQFDLSNVTVD